MFKIFNSVKDTRTNSTTQLNSNCQEPKMSIKKWYALQQKLREEQMARARAAE